VTIVTELTAGQPPQDPHTIANIFNYFKSFFGLTIFRRWRTVHGAEESPSPSGFAMVLQKAPESENNNSTTTIGNTNESSSKRSTTTSATTATTSSSQLPQKPTKASTTVVNSGGDGGGSDGDADVVNGNADGDKGTLNSMVSAADRLA
jgi:hypothetical protein